MKLRPLLQSLSIPALALGLSSCAIDPYGATVTTYSYSPGYQVATLPRGYTTVTVSGTPYYYYNDVYYRPRGSGYVVVRSPHHHRGPYGDRDHDGIRNRYDYHNNNYHVYDRIPGRYTTIRHGGRVYYRSGNTYYTSRGTGYIIVPRPY